MKSRKSISIIIPVHNEAPNIEPFYEEVTFYTDRLAYEFEFIFVDDGSSDNSVVLLEQLAVTDHRIRLVELARNFGKEAAISAGLHAARGNAALMIDADLQHPPKLIGRFIREWQKGADVVIGIREYSKQEGWFKRWASARFYQIMQKIAHTKITPHASDFRLLDRKVIDAFSRLTERNRMTRGLIDWLGFRRSYVHFVAAIRNAGAPSGSTGGVRQLLKLAVNSFTAYSLVPLKLAGYLGVFILVTATPAGALLYVERYMLNDPLGWEVRGTAMLAILIVILVGLVLACLGLVSLYIANIHAEVTNRPLYVVRRHLEEIPEDAPVMVLEGKAK
jgi:dolichol-phosphate mannosyltransferase